MQRRTALAFLSVLAGLEASGLSSATAASDEIRTVVPFPPGGGGDVLARTVVDGMVKASGLNLWVQNKPGAGGSIGTAQVAKAEPATGTVGYVTNGILCVNAHLYGNLGFDPLADLKPIGRLSTLGLLMVLNDKAVPGVTDFQSLIDFARRHPGELAYGSAGVGTTSHLAGSALAAAMGLELNHIPHAGGAASMMEVLAGRVPFMIDVMPNALPHAKSGRLKALAVTTPSRSPLLPEVPTMAELGAEGAGIYAWDGFVAPAGMPDDDVETLNRALQDALADPEVKARLTKMGAVAEPGTPADFAAFIRSEMPKWQALVKTVKATAA